VRLARYNAFLAQSREHAQNPEALAYVVTEDYTGALSDFMQKNAGKKLAAFASTPTAMLNLLGAAHELGLSTPEDLGVLGFDNLHWTKLISGGISVIEQPFYEVGFESAKMLLERIGNQVPDVPRHVELNSRLILRNSTMIS